MAMFQLKSGAAMTAPAAPAAPMPPTLNQSISTVVLLCFTNLAITLMKLSSQSGNNNQTVYLYVPLAVLTSLYPQLTNVSVLALLFLELCQELCS